MTDMRLRYGSGAFVRHATLTFTAGACLAQSSAFSGDDASGANGRIDGDAGVWRKDMFRIPSQNRNR